MGGGKDLLVARTEPLYEQGLRAVAGELGGLRLRGDEPSYGKEAGTYLRIIRQFLEGEFCEVRLYRILGSSLPLRMRRAYSAISSNRAKDRTSNFAFTEFYEVRLTRALRD